MIYLAASVGFLFLIKYLHHEKNIPKIFFLPFLKHVNKHILKKEGIDVNFAKDNFYINILILVFRVSSN